MTWISGRTLSWCSVLKSRPSLAIRAATPSANRKPYFSRGEGWPSAIGASEVGRSIAAIRAAAEKSRSRSSRTPGQIRTAGPQVIEQTADVFGPERDDQLDVGLDVNHALEHLQGMVSHGDLVGDRASVKSSSAWSMTRTRACGKRAAIRARRVEKNPASLRQGGAERGEIGGLAEHLSIARRRSILIDSPSGVVVFQRARGHVEQGLGDLADRVLGTPG